MALWSATGNVGDFTLKNFDLRKVEGGDSEAAKIIFGGSAAWKEVSEADRPSIGYVWFRQGYRGKLVRYRSNYDSSD